MVLWDEHKNTNAPPKYTNSITSLSEILFNYL